MPDIGAGMKITVIYKKSLCQPGYHGPRFVTWCLNSSLKVEDLFGAAETGPVLFALGIAFVTTS